jgi:hypothetical protein
MKYLAIIALIGLSISAMAQNRQIRDEHLQAEIASEIFLGLNESGAEYFSPLSLGAEYDLLLTQEELATGFDSTLNDQEFTTTVKIGYAFYNAEGVVIALLGTVGYQNHSNKRTPEELEYGSLAIGPELVLLGFKGKNVTSIKYLPSINAIRLANTFHYYFNYLDWTIALDFLNSLHSNDQKIDLSTELSLQLGPASEFYAGIGYRFVEDVKTAGGIYLKLGVRLRLGSTIRTKELPLTSGANQ